MTASDHRKRILRAAVAVERHLHKAEFYSSMGMPSAADYQRVAAHVECECAFRASANLLRLQAKSSRAGGREAAPGAGLVSLCDK